MVVNGENCTAEDQLQLLQQTVGTGVRKRFSVITKEPLLSSVGGHVVLITISKYRALLGT